MKAICTNGLVIDCGNFKAIDGGVILTEDVKRKRPIGFVPTGELRYVLPDEVAPAEEGDDASAIERPRSTETDVPSPAQQRTVARLRDRLDRLEAAVELSSIPDSDTELDSRSTDEPTSDTRATTEEHDVEPDTLRVPGGGEEDRDAGTADSTLDGGEHESEVDIERDYGAGDEHEDEADTDDAYPDLQRVDGLGPTYADRLHDGGIETLADLGTADVDEVATVADVGEARAQDWVTQASELV